MTLRMHVPTRLAPTSYPSNRPRFYLTHSVGFVLRWKIGYGKVYIGSGESAGCVGVNRNAPFMLYADIVFLFELLLNSTEPARVLDSGAEVFAYFIGTSKVAQKH